MLPVASHLISWFLGGVVLLTTLFMRTTVRPYALAFALIGYGGAGFVAYGLGQPVLLPSAVAAVVLGLLGYLIQPRAANR
jgi:uncharacterized protein (DUF2062 family)